MPATKSPRLLLPDADISGPLFVGIDLGGTNIKAALVDGQGQMVAFHTEPTNVQNGPDDAAIRMGHSVELLAHCVGLARSDIAAVGLGTPGPQDLSTGVLLKPGNFPGWENFPVRDRVAEHCGHAVTYANDATAAAYGEFWVGSGRDDTSLILLTLGTGVGGGIIIHDMTIEGAHSHGSECGHIIVDSSPTARMCPCGQPGHLEAYASATALKARASERIRDGGVGTLADAVNQGEPLTPILIGNHAEQGAMTFGRDEHPVGRAFLDRIDTCIRRHTFPTLAKKTALRFATLGGHAGSIGAAGLGRLTWKQQNS